MRNNPPGRGQATAEQRFTYEQQTTGWCSRPVIDDRTDTIID